MKVVGTNRKAQHDYTVLDSYEAGMVLEGSEVKSLRQSAVSLSDAYGEIRNGEVFLFNLHISPYKFSSSTAAEPKRKRKLLLKKEEINKMYGSVTQKGNTLIPLKVYFNDRGFAKVSLGICRKKRAYDKKEKILREESKRNLAKIKRITK
jgi:SsrA-binding protein